MTHLGNKQPAGLCQHSVRNKRWHGHRRSAMIRPHRNSSGGRDEAGLGATAMLVEVDVCGRSSNSSADGGCHCSCYTCDCIQWRPEDREQGREITLVAVLRKLYVLVPYSDQIWHGVHKIRSLSESH
jgi:hypothetical protein